MVMRFGYVISPEDTDLFEPEFERGQCELCELFEEKLYEAHFEDVILTLCQRCCFDLGMSISANHADYVPRPCPKIVRK